MLLVSTAELAVRRLTLATLPSPTIPVTIAPNLSYTHPRVIVNVHILHLVSNAGCDFALHFTLMVNILFGQRTTLGLSGEESDGRESLVD